MAQDWHAHSASATTPNKPSLMETLSPPQVAGTARAPMLPASGAATTTALREFLAFELGAEKYGIDILRVQEMVV
jgi:chemotaxis signal transduction protein